MYDGGRMQREVSCIWPLIVLNVLVFVCCQLGSRGYALQELLCLHPYYIKRLQLWRLVSYMFAHATTFHIFCNMWAVFIFGRGLERLLGCRRFLTLYFVSGVIGAATWCLVNWNTGFEVLVTRGLNMYRIPVGEWENAIAAGYTFHGLTGGCVGASGSVFGLLVAAAIAFPDVRMMLIFPPIALKMRTFAIVYIVIEILSLFDTSSNVAHIAHLGGALGGFLYMRRLCPNGSIFHRIFRWRRKPAMRKLTRDDFEAEDAEFMSSPEVARVLRKFSQVGHDGLTEEEREIVSRVVRIMNNSTRR